MTGIDRDSIKFAPSLQLEFEMPDRFESSTSLRKTVDWADPFRCRCVVAAISPSPVAMARTAAPRADAAEAMLAHRVVIDTITGRVRMAKRSKMPWAATSPGSAAPKASGQTARKAAVSGIESHLGMKRMQLAATQARRGAGVCRFDASGLQFSAIKRDADGKVFTECVHGDAAGHIAVHGKTAGTRHDH